MKKFRIIKHYQKFAFAMVACQHNLMWLWERYAKALLIFYTSCILWLVATPEDGVIEFQFSIITPSAALDFIIYFFKAALDFEVKRLAWV